MNPERVRAALERRPIAADLALAAGAALVGLFITLVLVVPNAVIQPPPVPVIMLWGLLLAAPLVLRRRFPVTVLVVTCVHFMGYWAVGQPNEIGAWLVLSVALYSAAVHGQRPRAGRVAAALAAVMAVIIAGLLVGTNVATPVEAFATIMFNTVPFAVAWPLGTMMRSLRQTRASLVERNRQLADERERNARQAIVEERVRIARELHDLAPQPDLERLPALIEQMRAAGLHRARSAARRAAAGTDRDLVGR